MDKRSDGELPKPVMPPLVCCPNLAIVSQAVVETRPARGNEERKAEGAARDQFDSATKAAQELNGSQQNLKDAAGTEVENHGDTIKKSHDSASITSIKRKTFQPTTPVRAYQPKAGGSNSRKSASGSKRKRRSRPRVESSETEMTSGVETSSGSELELDMSTPTERPNLRLRQRSVRIAPEDSDREVDAGAKNYGSCGSEEEYDFTKERKKKAKRKLKEAKKAARRASSRAFWKSLRSPGDL